MFSSPAAPNYNKSNLELHYTFIHIWRLQYQYTSYIYTTINIQYKCKHLHVSRSSATLLFTQAVLWNLTPQHWGGFTCGGSRWRAFILSSDPDSNFNWSFIVLTNDNDLQLEFLWFCRTTTMLRQTHCAHNNNTQYAVLSSSYWKYEYLENVWTHFFKYLTQKNQITEFVFH